MSSNVLIIPTVRHFDFYQYYPDFDGDVWFVGAKEDVNKDIPKSRFIGKKERLDFLGGDESFEGGRVEISVAYLMAYADGYEHIYTLDDDTIPFHKDFFDVHEERLGQTFGLEYQGLMVNPLGLPYFSRGFPYQYRTGYKEKASFRDKDVDVVFNMGLWHGIPDVNTNDYKKPWDAFRVYDGITQSYIPLCSMNICFKAELVPVYMQIPLDRYDDIISGYILSKILQGTNQYISFGHPNVMHLRYPRDLQKDIHLQTMTLPIIEMLPSVLNQMKIPEDTKDLQDKYLWIASNIPSYWPTIGRTEVTRLCNLMIHWSDVAQKF
jgi:hypothetical protein